MTEVLITFFAVGNPFKGRTTTLPIYTPTTEQDVVTPTEKTPTLSMKLITTLNYLDCKSFHL